MAVSAQYASVTNEAACSIDPLSFHNFRIIWYGKDYKQFCKGHPEVQLWIVTFFGSVVIQLWAPCICLHPPFFLHPFNFDHPSLLSSLAPPSLPRYSIRLMLLQPNFNEACKLKGGRTTEKQQAGTCIGENQKMKHWVHMPHSEKQNDYISVFNLENDLLIELKILLQTLGFCCGSVLPSRHVCHHQYKPEQLPSPPQLPLLGLPFL